MRITAINIPEVESKRFGDGLSPTKMERLGNVVVLAGKNGSGKSRLLKRVATLAGNYNSFISDKQTYARKLQELNQGPNFGDLNESIQNLETLLSEKHMLEISEEGDRIEVFPFVPKQLQLEDCYGMAQNQLVNFAQLAGKRGVDNSAAVTFAKIQSVQNLFWNATHPNNEQSAAAKDAAVREYRQLCQLITLFLHGELTRSDDGDAELFGFRLGQTKLSEGQTILLQFCVAIHSQATQLKDLIILMDEPENYLHPSVALELIDTMREHVTNGQIWIATHSIPLLAHIEASAIWWVEDGQVSFSGSAPKQVLQGLLGDEQRIFQLLDFVNLPFELASIRFAYQCLIAPEAVQTDTNDPQTNQIFAILKQSKKADQLRVLDFGAGKGRLADAIYAGMKSSPENNWLDYVALDASQKDEAYCIDAITKIYGTAEKRYFNDSNELLAQYSPMVFDVVLLCNVLHEIPVSEWLNLFAPEGAIFKLLKDDGFLLLVEDMNIPVGEKAHQRGFLVLDTAQLRTLFCVTDADSRFSYDAKREGRLKAHLIPKECVARISAPSRKDAIKEIIYLAKQRILALREAESDYPNGRLHGFWVQQLANAQLALDGMG